MKDGHISFDNDQTFMDCRLVYWMWLMNIMLLSLIHFIPFHFPFMFYGCVRSEPI
jgi:hypothetical protein